MTGWSIGLAVVALVVVAVAVAVVVARRDRSGRSDGSDGSDGSGGSGARAPSSSPGTGPGLPRDLAAPAGELVLLLFSASFCRTCRDTRAVLGDVATELPGVSYRVLDVATRPELPARLGVEATPTTLLVDAAGTELLRVAGVPRRRELVAAVSAHLPRRAV